MISGSIWAIPVPSLHKKQDEIQSALVPVGRAQSKEIDAELQAAHNADFQEATQRVWRSAQYQSRIVLPLMLRRRLPPTQIDETRVQLSIRRAASDALFLSMPVD